MRTRAVEPNIDNIRGLVFRVQAATTLNEYEEALSDIDELFPTPRQVKINGTAQTQTAAQYLRKIHPTSWTKFGNIALSPEEVEILNNDWNGITSYGSGCPLFGGRTTSAVESQNHALLLSGIRDSEVFGALLLFCNSASETLSKKRDIAAEWVKGNHTVTPRAYAMFAKQVQAATICTVRKSSERLFHVDDAVVSLAEDSNWGESKQNGDAHQNKHNQYIIPVNMNPKASNLSRTYTVATDTGICNRCADRYHLQLPCRHIIAAIYSESGCRTSTSGSFKFFHPSYTVKACMEVYRAASISMPFVPALLTNDNIQCPPLYNQAGGRTQTVRRDVASREKRIPNVGEPRKNKKSQSSNNRQHDHIQRVELAARMREYFSDEVRAMEKKKRSQYKCSRCGKAEGHNAAKCPDRSRGNSENDVLPGIYVVGDCPLELLRRQSAVSTSPRNPPEILNIINEFCV